MREIAKVFGAGIEEGERIDCVAAQLFRQRARFGETEDGGVGGLVLRGIGTLRLADDRGVALDVQDIVADLEGEADGVAVMQQRIDACAVAFAGCTVSQQGCNYVARLEVPLPALPGVSAVFKRGFVAVDAMVRGQARRFVVTHLEVQEPVPGKPLSMIFQAAQAAELITRLAAAPLPRNGELVLAGDLNSAPTDRSPGAGIVPPYRLFLAAGYIDTWTAYKGAAPGLTCCQDADLRNDRSKLTDRIDHVLVGTPPVLVLDATRIGENVADRTPASPTRPALWPSDHAGVSTRLYF